MAGNVEKWGETSPKAEYMKQLAIEEGMSDEQIAEQLGYTFAGPLGKKDETIEYIQDATREERETAANPEKAIEDAEKEKHKLALDIVSNYKNTDMTNEQVMSGLKDLDYDLTTSLKFLADAGYGSEANQKALTLAWSNPEGNSYQATAQKAVEPKPETETVASDEPEIENSVLSNLVNEGDEVVNKLYYDAEERIKNQYGSLDSAMNTLRESFSKVEDEESPTEVVRSISQMYRDGKFGEVGSKDAKERRAMFVMSEISKALGTISGNLLGKNTDIKSMADEVNITNLQQALDRHNKTKEEKRQALVTRINSIESLSMNMRERLEELAAKSGADSLEIFRDDSAMLRILEIEQKLGAKYKNLTPDQMIELAMAKSFDGNMQDSAALMALKAIDDPEMMNKIITTAGDAVGGIFKSFLGEFGIDFGGSE